MTHPLISLDNITVRLRDRWYLRNTSWEILQGEHWAVLGPNGSGKTTLARTLAGKVPVIQGTVRRHFPSKNGLRPVIHFVSSEERIALFREEAILDQARHFSGDIHETTKGNDLFHTFADIAHQDALKRLKALCQELKCADILNRSLHSLSTGEMNKLLLIRALLDPPVLLILDEPFEGLDRSSCKHLENILSRLTTHGVHVLLITHRMDELFPGISHILLMDDGRIADAGEKETILGQGTFKTLFRQDSLKMGSIDSVPAQKYSQTDKHKWPPALIEMDRVMVRYGTVLVLDQVRWTVNRGENWAITGQNGSGKSTLLSLITGDELQAYANAISIFGRKKGSGESVRSIKKNIGTVSHRLFTSYQQPLTVFEAVCSGFFDSIGLYRTCSSEQLETAAKWIKQLGLEKLKNRPFLQLSQGQRELVLIARAIVKSQLFLILDEPCAGLDVFNRRRVLDLIQWIVSNTATQLIYATHHQEELLPCITHHLRLDAGRVVFRGEVR